MDHTTKTEYIKAILQWGEKMMERQRELCRRGFITVDEMEQAIEDIINKATEAIDIA